MVPSGAVEGDEEKGKKNGRKEKGKNQLVHRDRNVGLREVAPDEF